MTNLILAVIGILLATFATLVAFNYGGDYFLDAYEEGDAIGVESAFANVMSSYRIYDNKFGRAPTNVENLTGADGGPALLESVPNFHAEGGLDNAWTQLTMDGDQFDAVTVSGLSSEVCAALNERNGGTTYSGGTVTNVTGCYQGNGGNVGYRLLGVRRGNFNSGGTPPPLGIPVSTAPPQ